MLPPCGLCDRVARRARARSSWQRVQTNATSGEGRGAHNPACCRPRTPTGVAGHVAQHRDARQDPRKDVVFPALYDVPLESLQTRVRAVSCRQCRCSPRTLDVVTAGPHRSFRNRIGVPKYFKTAFLLCARRFLFAERGRDRGHYTALAPAEGTTTK